MSLSEQLIIQNQTIALACWKHVRPFWKMIKPSQPLKMQGRSFNQSYGTESSPNVQIMGSEPDDTGYLRHYMPTTVAHLIACPSVLTSVLLPRRADKHTLRHLRHCLQESVALVTLRLCGGKTKGDVDSQFLMLITAALLCVLPNPRFCLEPCNL